MCHVKNEEKINTLSSSPWSFSKVNSYEICPRMFQLSYLKKVEKESNAFSEYGSFCHSLLERYYNGELEFFELSDAYEDEYDRNVVTPFPPCQYADLAITYYEQGLAYFDHFEGNTSNVQIIAVEEKACYTIGGYDFIGYIDLLIEKDGEYIIVDHKSKKSFKSKQEKENYLRQLYLYAGYVFEKYGKYPSKLMFNMFRVRGKETENFDPNKLHQAQIWFIRTIERIYQDTEYRMKFYVNDLEFSANNQYVKWKHIDESRWHNLISTDDLEINEGDTLHVAYADSYPEDDDDIYFDRRGREPNYIGVAITDSDKAPSIFMVYTWVHFTNDFFCEHICSTRQSCSANIKTEPIKN